MKFNRYFKDLIMKYDYLLEQYLRFYSFYASQGLQSGITYKNSMHSTLLMIKIVLSLLYYDKV